MFYIFYATALATAYDRRPKFVRAEHLATAEGENCAYGPTLVLWKPFEEIWCSCASAKAFNNNK